MASSHAISCGPTGICLAYASSAVPETPHTRHEHSLRYSRVVRSHCKFSSIVQVPKHAPASREQWKDWNQVWPISWRKPELTAVTAATAAAQAVTADEEQRMHAWMDRAFTLGEANEAAGGVCNAAVIVNPVSGET